MNNKSLKVIILIIIIFLSLLGIVKLVPSIELVISFLSLSFVIMGVIWSLIAKYDLSKGSSLRKYIDNFLACATFLFLYAVFDILEKIFTGMELFVYLEYIFISIAYLTFTLAAYRVLKLGQEFGFRKEVKKIKGIIKIKKKGR